ncbi:MAG: ribosomal RNA small subunit methyltransferase A [Trueperaceae bacterium]|nr:MAG: ribosomal RNA small subunit methyltransferase A [Trueperaceae bacterium]
MALKPHPLSHPSAVRALLQRHGIRANKGLGQNFLIDSNTLETIVATAEATSKDIVLEIGPGLGVLTRAMAVHAKSIIAIEVDARLIEVLKETLADLSNVELIHGDAMDYDFSGLPKRSLLVANLPYNIASTLIVRSLQSCKFKRLVFLIQREVAERLTAQPSEKPYGRLTLLCTHFGRARIVRHVSRSSFLPAPQVTSSIVRIDINPEARPEPGLFRLIGSSFRHRRKTLYKNLQLAGYNKETVLKALSKLGLDRNVRAEALELSTFRELWTLLHFKVLSGM